MSPIDLVIFDCDGVLVDSEPLSMRVLLKIISDEGVEIDRRTAFRSYLGRSLASISESLVLRTSWQRWRTLRAKCRRDLLSNKFVSRLTGSCCIHPTQRISNRRWRKL